MLRYAQTGESNKAEIINLFHASKSQQPARIRGGGKGLPGCQAARPTGCASRSAIEGNGLITIWGCFQHTVWQAGRRAVGSVGS